MRPLIVIPLFLLLACREKNIAPAEEPSQPPAVISADSGLKCENLPPPPSVFGWKDSTTDISKNIIAFTYDPVNANRVICMTVGDLTGYNRLFNYDLLTKERIHLGYLGDFLPGISKKGWVAFNTIDNDLFIIKTNGDSLRQLTYNNLSQNPQWDHTGRNLYYFQSANLVSSAAILKLNVFGTPGAFTLPAVQPHHVPFRKSNKIIYLQSNTGSVGLILRNLDTHEETSLIGQDYDPSLPVPFDNLCIDNNDENIYWSNNKGVLKCALNTLKIDTLLKHCPNYTYLNPMMSLRGNDLTVAMHIRKPLGPHVLHHSYRTKEINLNTLQAAEIKILE